MTDFDAAKQPGCDILIVDDLVENIRFLSDFLTEQNYQVRKAINGKTALMAIQAFPPDLILLDINMPGLNGYEVCQQLKANPTTQAIPIIFLSAADAEEDKIKALQVGGADYITKPFQLEEVLVRVRSQLMIQQLQHQLSTCREVLAQTRQALQTAQADLAALQAQ